MKKIIAFLIATCLLISSLTFSVTAEETISQRGTFVSQYIEYLPNGGYIEFSVWDTSDPHLRGSVYNKSCYKVGTAYDGNYNQVGVLRLTAKFSINEGISAVCTAASCSHTINNTAWTVENESAGRSGATATANADFVRKQLSIVVERISLPITLTCDKYGNPS